MAEIQLQDVTRRFENGTEAVSHVDLTIEDGEFVILVGPSGCGKSTLLRMIVGLEDVTEGTVLIDGEDVTGRAPRDRNLAMVFQSYALYPHLTVRQNMEFPLKLRKTPKPEMHERVQRAAEVLELEELLDRKPAQLSGGQRQRVAMGRAIVREPAAFLMDEPLSNLDAKLRVQMRSEIAGLQRRLHTTTVYVTHDQTEALTLGDRVAVLRKGALQQVASPKELYLHPGNIFVAGFIGSPAMNFFPARVDGDTVTLPMAEYELPEPLRRLGMEDARIIAGIRPEHFEDVDLVDTDADRAGVRFTARVDRLEWLGSELFAHFDIEKASGAAGDGAGGSSGLRDVAGELQDAGVRAEHEALTVARIDPASDIAEGTEATFWLDTGRIHYFDADTGENLLSRAQDMGPVEDAGDSPDSPDSPESRVGAGAPPG